MMTEGGVVRVSCWTRTSIGRKQIVAITGLGLSLFVLIHMLENMLILVGPRAYNEYSHMLVSNPLIYIPEIGLLLFFLVHLGVASALSLGNLRARDSSYMVRSSGAKRTSWIQRSLWPQGLLILAFVILHLATFKYGPYYAVNYGSGEIRDLHKLVIEVFHEPGYVVWYVTALMVLGFHLSHGIGSTIQTLGFHNPRFQKRIKCLSWAYAVVVACGFIVQPIYVYFIYQG